MVNSEREEYRKYLDFVEYLLIHSFTIPVRPSGAGITVYDNFYKRNLTMKDWDDLYGKWRKFIEGKYDANIVEQIEEMKVEKFEEKVGKITNIDLEDYRRLIPLSPEDIKPILIIWTPRDGIPEVKEAFSKIDYVDKLWLKFFDKPCVLAETKKFFTQHKEYTHMIIVLDDEVCPPDSVKILIKTLLQYDLPVLCGCFNYCNTGLDKKPYCTWCERKEPHKLLNVSFKPIDFEAFQRAKLGCDGQAMIDSFHFVSEEWRLQNPIIHQVWFQGFPLTVIRRDIYEKIGFKYDGSTDVPWAKDCAQAGIPQFCDFSLKITHMAGEKERKLLCNIGRRQYEIVLEKANVPLIIEGLPPIPKLNVLIVIDVYGWAFDFDSRAIKKYSRHNCTVKTIEEVTQNDIDFYDVIYGMHPSLIMSVKNRFNITKNRKSKNYCMGFACNPTEQFSTGMVTYSIPHDDSVDCIGCYSRQSYEYALKEVIPYDKKVYLLLNGVDTAIFKFKEKMPSNDFVVGWVGNSTRMCKRVHLLKRLNFPVKIKDDWGNQHFVKNRSQDGMITFYDGIDVLVSVSSSEGLPRPILEAMACGIPVVATDAGAVSGFVDKEWLVPANADEETIVKEINRRLTLLKNNPKLRKEVGRHNYNIIMKKWTSKDQVKLCDSMFERR